MKHKLRREFHPQLRQLWAATEGLDQYARHFCSPYFQKHPDELEKFSRGEHNNELARQIGVQCIGENWERNGFKFVPLVTKELFLRCSIDILFLRPEKPRFIMQSGDLDAKVKVIFDALRMPSGLSETGGLGPQEDESPFFVLLEDDKLVSHVSVTSDQLLVLPSERAMNPHDAFLVVHVRIKPLRQPPGLSGPGGLNFYFE